MRIQATKVFAGFINRTAKIQGFSVFAECLTLTENQYNTVVPFWDMDFCDYVPATGKYRVIRLSYPGDYYAPARYLTTADLTHEFRRLNVRTVDGLRDMVRGLCEI